MKFNKKGDSVLGFVIVACTAALIAATIIPSINDSLTNRQENTVEYYDSTDTIILNDN